MFFHRVPSRLALVEMNSAGGRTGVSFLVVREECTSHHFIPGWAMFLLLNPVEKRRVEQAFHVVR